MKMKLILLSAVASVALVACNPSDGKTQAGKDTAAQNAATVAAAEKPALDLKFDVPYTKFTLPNGLRVVVHEDHKAPIVAVGVWYHVGSKDEPEGKTGFAHLFEHLMFNGSEHHKGEYFKPFEAAGATNMNGTTWFDRTNYFENVPTPALDMALWMESDRMGHLLGAIDKKVLDEQRGVVQNEKRQGENQPYGTMEEHQLKGLFPVGHPYRHSTIGSMKDLNAASLDDVKGWFKQYYGAANTVLVLAGDITPDKAKAMVTKYFGDIPAGPPVKHLKEWVPVKETNVTESYVDQAAPQVRISRSWAVASNSNLDNAYLNLSADILANGKNSRLYQALVYKNQLAVSVSADDQPFELANIFDITVQLKPGADEAKANQLINDVMKEYLAKGPTADELLRSKTKILSNNIRGLEQIGGFGGKATALARGELYAGDPAFFEKMLDKMNRASVQDVTEVTKKWLGKGYYQLTVRPEPKYKTTASDVDRTKGVPAVGDMPSLKFPAIKEATLKNGMKVVVVDRPTVPVVGMVMQFNAGYAADAGRPLGTAKFALSMLDEGTKTRSSLEIAAEEERLGANIGTDSDVDMSQVFMSTLKPNLAKSLALTADIVRNPAFKQDELDRLRSRWLATIQSEKARPVRLALRTLPPLLYGKGHAYGIPLTGSGTEDSIKGLTRNDLVQFQTDWIRPDNATIFMVGDITLDEAVPALEKAFGDWQAPATPIPTKNIATVALPKHARVIIMDKPGSPQSLILAGHLFPPSGAKDYLAEETANDILGGEFTSRVNMNLREDKHWAYGAYTFTTNARGQRMWLVYAPVQTDKTVDSIEELEKEFTGYLGKHPATEAELEKIIQKKVNSLPGEFETGAAVMQSMVTNSRFGRPLDYVTTLKARYDALDLAKVQAAAKADMHPGQLTWLVVGDRTKIEAGIRKLGIGDVEVWDKDGNRLDK
ncbi:M16 family metallopeptidase [Kordiimonas marina]|uniref:M16 family metallopeptidase n=1 Tax=Kordiimonas marina TaxID=2872312 RepID=UPI001FF3CD18|nr:pitrilysin family protein [Kordiimonas marina]